MFIKLFNYLIIISLVSLNISCSLQDNRWGKSIEYRGNDLYYTSNITEETARKLGDYLLEAGFFQEESQGSSQITEDNGVYQFRIVVKEDVFNDKEFIKNAALFAATISKDVFDGIQVEIHLCDKNFKTVNIATYQYTDS